MKALSPIEIPELFLLIAKYLEQRHVVVCLEVCRSWNGLLQPLIWKSVTVGNVSLLSRDNIERHSRYVFNLTIDYPCPLELYTLTFPNLHTLMLTRRNAYRHLSQFDAAQLITLNPSLVYLSIQTIWVIQADKDDGQFWKAASGHPRLKRLKISQSDIVSTGVETFWDAFSKLQDVSLVAARFPGNGIQLAEWSFSQMRKLVFAYNPGVSHSEELEIILRCTNLQDLKWFTRSDNNIYEFANSIKRGSLPRLEGLKIHCSGPQEIRTNPITDKVSECIIDSMQQIIKLSLSTSGFGHLSFRVLRRHFSTLIDLDLRFSPGATSSVLQELLFSCPLLEKLRGKSILAKDVVEGREWVCLSMKGLEVSFRFGESEQDLQPLVFKRLSSLVRIEKFDIRDFYTDGIGVCRLDMRLAKGLGQLSRWKNIKSLNVDSMQSIEEADFRWMMMNWPRLDGFYGQLNKDEKINQHLQEILKARGIRTW